MSLFKFTKDDLGKLFANKYVVVIGDSVMRTVYKDIVVMLQFGRNLTARECKEKGESVFNNDKLIEGGKMTNGKDYREVRQFLTPQHLVQFYFVTRVYSGYVETIFADFHKSLKPDIVIVNSCLWDISRYGVRSMDSYKQNLQKFGCNLKRILPSQTAVVWTTTLPVSSQIRAGVLNQGTGFLSEILRLDVLVANNYASQVAKRFGFGVLDLHFLFRNQLHLLAKDGVHWVSDAHRKITNIIIGYTSIALNIEIPYRCRLDRLLLPSFDRDPSSAFFNEDYGLSYCFDDNETRLDADLLKVTVTPEIKSGISLCTRDNAVYNSRQNTQYGRDCSSVDKFEGKAGRLGFPFDNYRCRNGAPTFDRHCRDFKEGWTLDSDFKENWKPYKETGLKGVYRPSEYDRLREVEKLRNPWNNARADRSLYRNNWDQTHNQIESAQLSVLKNIINNYFIPQRNVKFSSNYHRRNPY